MMKRRAFMALAAAATLAACAEVEPKVDQRLASTLRVTQVTATTTVTRKETALPKDQIVEAARSKMAAALASANPAGSRAVRAEVVVVQFHIANPVAGALLGSRMSSIVTDVKLIDVATGAVVKDTFRVDGVTEARPTIFGAAAIKAPAVELNTITDDLAKDARFEIFGK